MGKLSKKDLKIGIPLIIIGLLPTIFLIIFFIKFVQIKDPNTEETTPSSYVQIVEMEERQTELV